MEKCESLNDDSWRNVEDLKLKECMDSRVHWRLKSLVVGSFCNLCILFEIVKLVGQEFKGRTQATTMEEF